MEKNKIIKYQIFSVIFTFILGTLLHFTYQISSENGVIAIFSAINESVWEHLKLLFFPMLITIIIGIFYTNKRVPNFICAKTIGTIAVMLFTVTFFYTYTGVLGKNISVIDISSFFIATILGEFIGYIYIINNFRCNKKLAIAVLVGLAFCFAIFTFRTPNIGIFKDPITNQYGIINKI